MVIRLSTAPRPRSIIIVLSFLIPLLISACGSTQASFDPSVCNPPSGYSVDQAQSQQQGKCVYVPVQTGGNTSTPASGTAPTSLPSGVVNLARQMPSQNDVLSDLQAQPINSTDTIQVSPLPEGNGYLLVCHSSNGGDCRFKAQLYGGLLVDDDPRPGGDVFSGDIAHQDTRDVKRRSLIGSRGASWNGFGMTVRWIGAWIPFPS